MSRRAELLALLVSDAFALILAYVAFVLACQRWGWLDHSFAVQDLTLITAALLCTGWLVLFLFAGMYQERFAGSRFDESVTLLKVVTVGSLLLFFSVFIDRMGTGSARLGIGFYWGAVVVAVATGRLGVRAVQKALLLRGRGVHKAIVVGGGVRWDGADRPSQPTFTTAAGAKACGTRTRAEPRLICEAAKCLRYCSSLKLCLSSCRRRCPAL